MELFFGFQGGNISELKKATFAVTYMRGQAQKWIKPYLLKYLINKDDQSVLWFKGFATFRKKIKKTFGATNEVGEATKIIQHLRQKGSCAEYSTRFQQYAVQTGWDDGALMIMYRRGLKDSVKDELIRTGAEINNMDYLIEKAIDINDKLYERSIERRHNNRGARQGKWGGGFRTRERTNRTPNPYGPMPMELDVFEKKKKPGFGKQHQRGNKAGVTCYACGRIGHMARDCRSKNKVPRPQINMFLRLPVKPKLRRKDQQIALCLEEDTELTSAQGDKDSNRKLYQWDSP